MQLISKLNEGIRFSLCVIDIFSKYTWVIPLKDKKGVTISNAFQKILNNSKRKQNKIWIDKGSEFYNRSIKSWLQDNAIEMYSPHSEGKSVAERFIRTLKTKIYKYMTSISKNVYVDNIYLLYIYINFGKESNNKDPKFKVGNYVRISKYKNIFSKGYTPNLSEEMLVII